MAELVKMSFSIAGLMNAAAVEALHPVMAASSSVHLFPVKYHTAQVTASAAKPAATGRVAISRKSWNADMSWFIVTSFAAAPCQPESGAYTTRYGIMAHAPTLIQP